MNIAYLEMDMIFFLFGSILICHFIHFRIRVMRDLEGQHLIRAVRSYLDNTNRVIRVMKKRYVITQLK